MTAENLYLSAEQDQDHPVQMLVELCLIVGVSKPDLFVEFSSYQQRLRLSIEQCAVDKDVLQSFF